MLYKTNIPQIYFLNMTSYKVSAVCVDSRADCYILHGLTEHFNRNFAISSWILDFSFSIISGWLQYKKYLPFKVTQQKEII